MEAFPAFFPLTGARVVIAGEGEGAEAKARLLQGSPATVERIAGEAALSPQAYAGARLAFIAHPDGNVCAAAARAARAAGVVVNVVDHPELSDFHTPAIIDRGQVVAAIGTAGAAPIVAALLRAELEARIPPALGALAEVFGRLRDEIRAALPDLSRRRALLRVVIEAGPVADAAEAGDLAEAEKALRDILADADSFFQLYGRVALVSVPEHRDLLSLGAARVLAEADLLILDAGADPDIAVLARRDAPRLALAQTDAAFLSAETAEGRLAVVLARPPRLDVLAADLKRLGVRFRRFDPAPGA
jgi:precorrin-2 dehydrogenase/sirohydrochlorin ferrochelatase